MGWLRSWCRRRRRLGRWRRGWWGGGGVGVGWAEGWGWGAWCLGWGGWGWGGGAWQGPSSVAMMGAVVPYVGWLSAAASKAEGVASQARVAAGAFEAALSAT